MSAGFLAGNPSRRVRAVLDNVARIGKHILDVLVGEFRVFVVNDNLATDRIVVDAIMIADKQ
jgi:hypothetical protein